MCIRVERHMQIEQSVKCCSTKLHLKNQKKLLGGSLQMEKLTEKLQFLFLDTNSFTADGGVASAGLRAQRRNIDPRSRCLAGHRPDEWPYLDGGSV